MIVDIVGDLLSMLLLQPFFKLVSFGLMLMFLQVLFIPCRLIWKIKVRWAQKVALALTLCLTIVTIICTIIRAAGLRSGNKIDSVWETYWQYIAAATGLSMTAAAAFRSLFISHQTSQRRDQQESDSGRHWLLYTQFKQAVRRLLTKRNWRFGSASPGDSDTTLRPNKNLDLELGKIERRTITGLRSFIHGFGRAKNPASQVMHSQTLEEGEEHDDTWPLSGTAATNETVVSSGYPKVSTNKGSGRPNTMLARPEKVRAIALHRSVFV